MRREFDAGQAAISQEMQVQRDETALIKEDYQILNERFNKQQILYENQVNDLKEDAKKVAEKVKTLQDFHDKYDTIL